MWPKALAQLIDFAPQIVSLLPLADRFFKDKAANDSATRQALESLHNEQLTALEANKSTLSALSDRIHADLGALTTQQTTQVTRTDALQRQVADLEKHLSSTRADALAAKQATEALEGRLTRIEASQGRAQTLGIVAVVLLLAILILLVTLFLRAR